MVLKFKRSFTSRGAVATRAYVKPKVKCYESRRPTLFYASQRVPSMRDYQISVMAEPIKFWVVSNDSLAPTCIIKVFLFFLSVPYERRYRDAKSKSRFLHLRNVIVIVAKRMLSSTSFWHRGEWRSLLHYQPAFMRPRDDVSHDHVHVVDVTGFLTWIVIVISRFAGQTTLFSAEFVRVVQKRIEWAYNKYVQLKISILH